MSKKNIVQAWKNPSYRNSLSEAERAALPENPAGSIQLSDAELGQVAGGAATALCTHYCTMRGSCDCSTAWPRGLPC